MEIMKEKILNLEEMKEIRTISAVFLLMMTGCGGNRQVDESNGFITVDVTSSYPKKELILQDFMDVEYVALETTDEFLCQGLVQAIGKEIIVAKNRINDGDIFIFDRNGKGLRKFNRHGRGDKEYLYIGEIILDEDSSEIFVNDRSKILVYDLFGNYKRSLRYDEGAKYFNINNFDKENLICHDASLDNTEISDKSPFVIVSKQDGSINKCIQITFQQKRPGTKRIEQNGIIVTAYTSNFPDKSVMPYHNSWILTVYSNDTIFQYLPDHKILPFLARKPSIEQKNAEAFLSPEILTERYYFLQTERMEPEIQGTSPMDIYMLFPKTNLMYDRQENAIYEYTVYNDDFSNRMAVDIVQKTVGNEIAFSLKLEAEDLVEAYENDKLKGKLKEVAANLTDDDNPVIMIAKYKK